MFFTVSIITVIVYGYHFGVDFVHTIRSITVTAYFLAIILSGQYQNPKLCLYTSILVSVEYAFLFLVAVASGVPIYAKMETFRENILTYDVLVVYIFFFSAAGLLMYRNTRRHQILMMELKESSHKLYTVQEKAKLDGLTQILNRRSIDELINYEIYRCRRDNQPLGLLLMDIDHFKLVNDKMGHLVGDHVLKEIVKIISSCLLRSTDDLGRYGGEEFCVLLPSNTEAGAMKIAESIRKSVADHQMKLEDETVRITISIGVFTAVPDGKLTISDFYGKADEALYRAKNNGRNRVEK